MEGGAINQSFEGDFFCTKIPATHPPSANTSKTKFVQVLLQTNLKQRSLIANSHWTTWKNREPHHQLSEPETSKQQASTFHFFMYWQIGPAVCKMSWTAGSQDFNNNIQKDSLGSRQLLSHPNKWRDKYQSYASSGCTNDLSTLLRSNGINLSSPKLSCSKSTSSRGIMNTRRAIS